VIDALRERIGPDAIAKGRGLGAEHQVVATRRLIDDD
jgi:hypothetical protein